MGQGIGSGVVVARQLVYAPLSLSAGRLLNLYRSTRLSQIPATGGPQSAWQAVLMSSLLRLPSTMEIPRRFGHCQGHQHCQQAVKVLFYLLKGNQGLFFCCFFGGVGGGLTPLWCGLLPSFLRSCLSYLPSIFSAFFSFSVLHSLIYSLNGITLR